jgi:hypothetical protein
MESVERLAKDLFAKLDGTPAHVLIIAGLALVLFAPLIPSFKLAEVSSARSAADQAQSLIDLDLEELRRTQEEERKKDKEESERDARSAFTGATLTPEEQTRQQEERQKREAARQQRETDRQKALEQKQEELKKKYDTISLRREVLDAQASAAGMRWHLVLAWLGRLALLVGLLTLTLRSEGVRQWVLLIVLLVVMFSALSGVNLNFLARGSLGEEPQTESTLPSTAPPGRPPR